MLRVHGRSGTEVIVEARSHVFHYEMGAMAALSGLLPRPVFGPGGEGFQRMNLACPRQVLGQALDRLRGALGLPKDQWGRRLLPTDPPRFAERRVNPDDLDEAFAVALRQRPELAQRRLELSQAGLDLAVARADRLPQLDLGLAYGLVGQRVTFQETMAQLFAAEVPGISVSATFAWASTRCSRSTRVSGVTVA